MGLVIKILKFRFGLIFNAFTNTRLYFLKLMSFKNQNVEAAESWAKFRYFGTPFKNFGHFESVHLVFGIILS